LLRKPLQMRGTASIYALLLAGSLVFRGEVPAVTRWSAQAIPTLERAPDRIVFVNPTTGWISSFFAGVLKTQDGGFNWSRLDSNLTAERIESVWFATERLGWAIATSYSGEAPRRVILVTKDGGSSWREQLRADSQPVYFVDIWFFDAEHGWVVGSVAGDPLILATRDGGEHWETQFRGGASSGELRQLRFADAKTGWAVGPSTILQTRDGGANWSLQFGGPSGVWLNDLAVISADEAWAAGGWGFLLHTRNGGKTWTPTVFPGGTQNFVWRIRFADPMRGWVCGAKGGIYSTIDGGETWQRQESPTDVMLTDMAVTSLRVFITAGPSEVLVLDRP
jgi:photosystem II stability/assembly factor-like uncharacterized protein